MKSTPLTVFIVAFQNCRNVIQVLNMCMKKLNVEENVFDKFTEFLT